MLDVTIGPFSLMHAAVLGNAGQSVAWAGHASQGCLRFVRSASLCGRLYLGRKFPGRNRDRWRYFRLTEIGARIAQ